MALQNELDALEQQLQQLLALVAELAADRAHLQQREQDLLAECARQQQKNSTATQQVEGIIALLHQQAVQPEPEGA